MKTVVHQAQYHPRFGITDSHWAAILAYATHHRLFVFVRGGKPAAIRWIELGFPGKPLELKTKVDPESGLLVARTENDRLQVFAAGHRLLTRTPQGWKVTGPAGQPGGPLGFPAHDSWAREGVVIERGSGLPFTSDYDLAAVIPSAGFDFQRDVLGFSAGKNRSTGLAEQVAIDLNAIFGSKRFRHGPQAVLDGMLANDPNAQREDIVAFCANGEAYWFTTPLTEEAASMQFRDLVLALHPQARPQLTN